MRLNKALAAAGVCSRRRADELVFAGKVTVNGQVAQSPGLQVEAGDQLVVDGQPVAQAQDGAFRYVLLHKPVEVVTTAADPQGRRTVLELLPAELTAGHRLFPVGRLDYFSEGLLLLTDDGDLAHRLMHPSHHLEKVYHVLVRGAVDDAALEPMRQGMTLAEGEQLAPVRARVVPRLGRDDGKTLLELTLVQGLNRQVRRMCRDLGLTVLRLTRTREGPLQLGTLPRGQARVLEPAEVGALRAAVGLS